MRVLFTTWAQSGHYQPMAPLGWALRAAGHEVLVATPPGFAGVVTGSGLPVAVAGPDIDVTAELRRRFAALAPEAFDSNILERSARWDFGTSPAGQRVRDLAHNQFGRETLRVVLDGCAAMIDDVLDLARAWRPDLVVFEPMGLVGPVVAAVLGIPTARHLWAPDYSAPMQGIANRILGPLLVRFGLDTIDVTGTVTLDPIPPRLQVVDGIRRQPIRYIGYNGPRPVPDWLFEPPARPRVCVTWGTTAQGVGLPSTYLARDAVSALGDLDVDVVVAMLDSQRDLFDELPDNVTHFGPVPLLAFLPTCAAVVHQVGGGTLMSSVVSGVPQLVIPTTQDGIFNARYLAGTGAGIHLREADATVGQIRESVRALLTEPGYRADAYALRDEAYAMPSPAEVVATLVTLAYSGQRTG